MDSISDKRNPEWARLSKQKHSYEGRLEKRQNREDTANRLILIDKVIELVS